MFSRHGPPRVMGVLATTRAIGDHDLRPYGVVPTPEVVSLRRDPQQEFLVVATDGLWDYITNEVGAVTCPRGSYCLALHLLVLLGTFACCGMQASHGAKQQMHSIEMVEMLVRGCSVQLDQLHVVTGLSGYWQCYATLHAYVSINACGNCCGLPPSCSQCCAAARLVLFLSHHRRHTAVPARHSGVCMRSMLLVRATRAFAVRAMQLE